MVTKNALLAVQILNAARDAGLNMYETKGWVGLGKFGVDGPRVYITNTEEVTVMHLSGFELDTELYGLKPVPEDKRPSSRVKQEVDFTKPAGEILANIKEVFAELAKLGKFQKKAKATAAASEPKKVAAVKVEEQDEAALRKAKILAKAKELIATGMPVRDAAIAAQADVDKES
jgi:hypothetical protein